ncbi:MAG: hypothetical protein LBQ88_11720 [Treponema sp.]|jgi:hypothetical protein|nr:hypothetical protein [Treponema sp.]
MKAVVEHLEKAKELLGLFHFSNSQSYAIIAGALSHIGEALAELKKEAVSEKGN